MNNAPCMNCPQKGCGAFHEQCGPYLEWKRKREQAKAEERKNDVIKSSAKFGRSWFEEVRRLK